MRTLRVLLNSLLGLGLLGTSLSILSRLTRVVFDVDTNQFLEASRQQAEFGISRVPFFVNSVTGLDIFAWSHQFPSWLYSFLGVDEWNIFTFNFVVVLEMFLAVLISYVLTRLVVRVAGFNSGLLVLAITVFVVFEPLANKFFFGHKAFLRWALIFGLVGFWMMIKYWNSTSNYRFMWALGCGLCVGLSPLAYVSLGVPVGAALAIVFLMEVIRRGLRGSYDIVFFGVGVILPMVVALVKSWGVLGAESFLGLAQLVLFYTSEGTVRHALEVLYSLFSFVVPDHGLSVIPIGLMALLFNILRYKELSSGQRFLVRMLTIVCLVWLGFLLLVPSHLFPGRMAWLIPLLLVQIVMVFQSRVWGDRLALFVVSSVVFQVAYQLWLFEYGLLMIAPLAYLCIATWLVLMKVVNRRMSLALILVLFAIVLLPTLVAQIRDVKDYVYPVARYAVISGHWPYEDFLLTAIDTTTDFVEGKRVLTNLPFREIFGEADTQAISKNRGLFSGAASEASDVVVIFYRDGVMVGGEYGLLSMGDEIYYRGFGYKIEKELELSMGYRAVVGWPIELSERAIMPVAAVDPAEASYYVAWRRSLGLETR